MTDTVELKKQVQPVTIDDLVVWQDMKSRLAALKEEEMTLRKRIYAQYFPEPVEGTNKTPLAGGWILKANRVIERKVDIGALQAMSTQGGPLHEAGINPNVLIKWVPELDIKPYRLLTEKQRLLFDQALVIKDGSPQVEIALPAAAAKAAAAANPSM